ncbi:hypothetical protein DFH07DRAFT_352200 [Mycena maculata]|uniref:AB hydrolase-1 domain-containing protein n=1 Tax=Mycena maculata TaxID=230809 RepID=A0AAD7JL85_9AGAR|nr:hypothetical protein DFH07DRAFT_352200 [Mycena maculata]
MPEETFVHLVYIHGFQGNDTSFQTFPTDLQQHLSANIPSHLNINIRTSLYPTYKSRKPIALATHNFLAWLSTQPPGPVILLAHSMGGLLAADAATDSSNSGSIRSRRILGVIAFDVPFLGMHPHVVISGIASLFPADDGDKTTEGDMNQHSDVQIVDDQVTDDWDAFKKGLDANRSSHSLHSLSHSPSPSPHSAVLTPTSPQLNPFGLPASPLVDKTLSFLSTHSNDPLVRWMRKHSDEPFSAGKRFIVEYFQFGSCMFDPSGLKERYARLVAWPSGLWINYWTQTSQRPPKEGEHAKKMDKEEEEADNDVALLQTGMTSMSTVESYATAETSLSPAPSFSAPSFASTATSQSTASASTIPSPVSPTSTSTSSDAKALARAADKERKAEEKERRGLEKAREKELKTIQKQRVKEEKVEKARSKGKHGHHFIVLPTGLGQILGGSEKWEKVVIGGVDDEVAAHTGLFIRGQNLDYEGLVERVGKRVLGWCETING